MDSFSAGYSDEIYNYNSPSDSSNSYLVVGRDDDSDHGADYQLFNIWTTTNN